MKKMKLVLAAYMLVIMICSLSGTIADAAVKDKQKPTVTITKCTDKPTNQSVKLVIKATDKSGIATIKYASGMKNESYFKSSGKVLKLDKNKAVNITLSKNGSYTFFVKDKAGNVTLKTSKVSNIDKNSPTCSIKSNTTEPINTNVILSVTVNDKESGISKLQYLSGTKKTEDFVTSKPESIPLTKNQGKVTIGENGYYTFLVTDKAGNTTLSSIQVTNIDKTLPTITSNYSVMNQRATVQLNANDADSGIKRVLYVKGNISDVNASEWENKATEVPDLTKFTVKSAGTYSIMAEDVSGNRTIESQKINLEMNAVWISYLELDKSKKYTESQFKTYINKMFDESVKLKMNAVIVQVRPTGDAMYPSSYFPWSAYASGTQGKNPGYDPLSYMIEAAHKRGLEFHAWINPYRVTISGTKVSALSSNNQARIWRESGDSSLVRNVLSYNSKLYYNPASTDVQNLIINGVKELVSNYNIDGIHFDDYFYPSLGTNYKNNFDAPEYVLYCADCSENGTTALSIENWRRNNVSNLVKKVYKAIKGINPNVKFGISPAGNISNLKSASSYYVDIEKWLSSSDYLDYICPQIYWSFNNKYCPFDKTVDNWKNIRKSSSVNLYIGIAAYRAGTTAEPEWKACNDVMKRQVLYGRNTGSVDGYMFFRYDSMKSSNAQKEVTNLLSVLK